MCSRVFYYTIFSSSLSLSVSLALSVTLSLFSYLSLSLSLSLSLTVPLSLTSSLSHTHTHTLQMNNALKMALDQGATMKMIAEDWEFLQIQVSTYFVLKYLILEGTEPLYYVCLSVWLSVRLSVCLSVRLSVYLSVFLSVCLSVCLSICLSVYLSVCLSICLSICLSVTPDEQQKLSSVPRTLYAFNYKCVSSVRCGLFVCCEHLCDLILHYIVFLLFYITRLHPTPLNSALLCCALLSSNVLYFTLS